MIQMEPVMSPSPISQAGWLPSEFSRGPALAWVKTDPRGMSMEEGSACAPSSEVFDKAVGELIERRAFSQLFNVPSTSSLTLNQLANQDLGRSLERSFLQTAQQEISNPADLSRHPFKMIEVMNLFSGISSAYPQVIPSLHGEHPDRNWYPVSDSVGCSAHTNPQDAFNSAWFEFIERQSLVLNWLTGYATAEWELSPHPGLSAESRQVLKTLLLLGNIRCFQISPFNSIFVVLLLFQGRKNQFVRYCVASGAGLCPLATLDKTLMEMWQSFCFMYNQSHQVNSSLPLDIYQSQFLQANKVSSAERFHVWHEPLQKHKLENLTPTRQNLLDTLHELKRISPLLFLFCTTISRGSTLYCIMKVTSPDFFLNMSIPDLNLHNPFLARSGLNLIPGQANQPLPFP